MRNKNTITRQEKLIDVRVRDIRKALASDPFGGLFNGDSQTEATYLMGASHALRWVKNENVYEPATFRVTTDRDTVGSVKKLS